MGRTTATALLALAALAAAEDPPQFKTEKEAREAAVKARAETLQRLEAEGLLIPDRFLEAEWRRRAALRARHEKRWTDARDEFAAAAAIYPTCIEPARAKLAELEALREKRPPEPKLAFKARKAVHRALEWLARHQDAVGRWDCAGFMKHDPEDDKCNGPGDSAYDPGVTALAVLAFLEAGFMDRDNHYALEVHRGLQWLRAQEDREGVFSGRASHHYIYNHAIATIALAKARALTKDARLDPALGRAADYLLDARNAARGWRYEPGDGESDTSATTWCFRALHAAKEGGIEIDLTAAAAGARAWLRLMTSPDGRVGYNLRGAGVARPGEKRFFPRDRSRAMTAAGTVLRVLLDGDDVDRRLVRASLAWCLQRPPDWRPRDIDMYYWYYGTLACRADAAAARKWKRPLHKALLGNQHPSGAGARTGSWDPLGVWGAEGGRVYATALLALTLLHAG